MKLYISHWWNEIDRVLFLVSFLYESHLWYIEGKMFEGTLYSNCGFHDYFITFCYSYAIKVWKSGIPEIELKFYCLCCRPEDLRIPFGRYGPVKDVYLPKNYYTGYFCFPIKYNMLLLGLVLNCLIHISFSGDVWMGLSISSQEG